MSADEAKVLLNADQTGLISLPARGIWDEKIDQVKFKYALPEVVTDAPASTDLMLILHDIKLKAIVKTEDTGVLTCTFTINPKKTVHVLLDGAKQHALTVFQSGFVGRDGSVRHEAVDSRAEYAHAWRNKVPEEVAYAEETKLKTAMELMERKKGWTEKCPEIKSKKGKKWLENMMTKRMAKQAFSIPYLAHCHPAKKTKHDPKPVIKILDQSEMSSPYIYDCADYIEE